jgi:hypothetical protein
MTSWWIWEDEVLFGVLLYLDVCNGVFSLAFAGEVVAGPVSVFAGEADFQHTVDAECLILVAVDGVGYLLGRGAREVVHLALVGRTAAVCGLVCQAARRGGFVQGLEKREGDRSGQ